MKRIAFFVILFLVAFLTPMHVDVPLYFQHMLFLLEQRFLEGLLLLSKKINS